MSDFSETRVENLEPKEKKKKSSAAAKKNKKSCKKSKDSDSSVVESSEESTEAQRSSKKYCILHSNYSHAIGTCKDLCAMVNKHKQKRNKVFRAYGKSN